MRPLPFSKIRRLIVIFSILLLTGGIGYRLGERKTTLSVSPDRRLIINEQTPAASPVDFSLFWDVWQRVFRSYIDKDELDPKKLAEGAIFGMVNAIGDPYTTFLPAKENREFKQDLGGEFEGIGAQLGQKEGRIIVVAPLKGTPAEKAGVKAGDWILKVNDEETIGWSIPQAVNKIRGPRGSTVTLSILHENAQKPEEIAIVRATIQIPSVDFWVKTPVMIEEISGLPPIENLKRVKTRIAYIHLSRFGDHTNEDWEKAVKEIARQLPAGDIAGLVFDLRNNPGGYLDGSVWIASEFIKSGTIVSQVNSDGTRQDYSVVKAGKLLDVPMVVIVNQGSASAAEIVAGAIRDFGRGKIVGETTFGKGSVQTPEDLPGGAGLHITTGKWLLPKGDSIHKKGITPDVLVEMEDATATTDAQLAKAIELLLE